jgi:hypothetical protein
MEIKRHRYLPFDHRRTKAKQQGGGVFLCDSILNPEAMAATSL